MDFKIEKNISAKEMKPYLDLVYAIIKQAKKDVKKKNKYSEEAEYFLNESSWGNYLIDMYTDISHAIDKSDSDFKGSINKY